MFSRTVWDRFYVLFTFSFFFLYRNDSKKKTQAFSAVQSKGKDHNVAVNMDIKGVGAVAGAKL